MEKFFKSQFFNQFVGCIFALIYWKITEDFELTMVMMSGLILGYLYYMDMKNEK